MTATLRRVLVRPPALAGFATWGEYGWRSEPDVAKLAEEHEALCTAIGAGGAEVVLHLRSLLSPLDADLVVAYLPLLPVRLVQLLQELEIRIVEVPAGEFETMGPNVLALAPRVGLALEGNPETRRRLERAGVDVSVYRGDEMSRKGDGGPTCLTRPLLRA